MRIFQRIFNDRICSILEHDGSEIILDYYIGQTYEHKGTYYPRGKGTYYSEYLAPKPINIYKDDWNQPIRDERHIRRCYYVPINEQKYVVKSTSLLSKVNLKNLTNTITIVDSTFKFTFETRIRSVAEICYGF